MELLELLQPWLPHAALALPIDVLPTQLDLSKPLWLDATLSRDRGLWVTQVEALELLALFRERHVQGAWTLLLDALGKSAYVDDVVGAQTPLRFRLVVHSSVYVDDAAFTALRDLIGRGADVPHSPEFEAAKAALLASFPKRTEQPSRASLCLQQHDDDVPIGLPGSLAVLERLATLAHIPPHPTSCFEWTHVSLGCLNTATLDILYEHVSQLLDHGICVEQLTITQRAAVADASTPARFWERNLARIQSLVFSTAMEEQSFRALCGALAASPAPLEMVYWPQHGADSASDVASRWTWLTEALFQRASTRHVLLDLSGITFDEADAIARVPAAADPHAQDGGGLEVETSRRSRGSVVLDHLSFKLSTETSLHAAASLLKSIGGSVRRLSVDCGYTPLDHEAPFWTTMLDVCASLERLDVAYASLTSLTWLFDQPSQLSVLSLDACMWRIPRLCSTPFSMS